MTMKLSFVCNIGLIAMAVAAVQSANSMAGWERRLATISLPTHCPTKKKGVEPHFSEKGRNQILKNAVRPLILTPYFPRFDPFFPVPASEVNF